MFVYASIKQFLEQGLKWRNVGPHNGAHVMGNMPADSEYFVGYFGPDGILWVIDFAEIEMTAKGKTRYLNGGQL